ncbi:hypothetical protein BRADI_3g03882v3 [Brachypodium distachyon]|uniref:Uncharacterized protein n=2 Tax=Brachypodium distachyon TaxID=15368 RepID=I1HX83_BRADI|nr:hypothetical protein BRADI_3g03882v3 [Brachypodium distachyon]
MARIVSTTAGMMKPLVGKLAMLMGDDYNMLTGMRTQVSFLEKELSAMSAALEKMELMDDEHFDPQAKNWRDHVREMSYDMEDCVDDFMRDLGSANATSSGFVQKITQFFQTMWASYQIGRRIEELKVLALEANERRLRYKIDDYINSASGVVPIDPRISAIYQEAAGLVGIDGPREELVGWLKDSSRKLKVVSIVGFGGLGKTTLAKQVYDEIRGQFGCKAFVPVSQRPDMTSLLTGLQLKLGMEESSRVHELQDIIDNLRKYLTNKRYLIVVDDLWDHSAWNAISCAFPENGTGSRIIVTTRVEDVARGACFNHRECIYRMKPLKEEESRRLFFNRVFGSEDACPQQFEEISDEILKKCGGLPLAIITIASLLASHQAGSRSDWESIRNSLGAKFATKPTLEEMRSILNLSYMHIPLHLRVCFLYLGMYPEDHEINRDDLVRQWIAEGFVNHLHGSDLEDVGKSYFNELINRSMIQSGSIKYGEVVSCRVHDMMLDLILSKCAEDNFICVAYNSEDVARMHGSEYKVRRLSLGSSSGDATSRAIDTSMSQVRSFSRFGESKYAPPLTRFKHLRMLLFKIPYKRNMIVDLTAIGQLFQLRYLHVSAESGCIELPAEVRGLVNLETLEIYARLEGSLPSDIYLLSRLTRLILPYRVKLPERLKNMKSLHTLCCSNTWESSLEDLKGLGELPNIRELSMCTYQRDMVDGAVDALLYSVGSLRKLRSLSLNCRFSVNYDEARHTITNPPPFIEKLILRGRRFNRVPRFIGELRFLRSVSMHVVQFPTDEVHVVGNLSSLVKLRIWDMHVPEDGAAVIGAGLFPALEVLVLVSDDDDVTACMKFEAAGVMPSLRRLTLRLCHSWRGAAPVGLEHLLALEQIRLEISSSVHEHHSLAESTFRIAAEAHPRHPSVMINVL